MDNRLYVDASQSGTPDGRFLALLAQAKWLEPIFVELDDARLDPAIRYKDVQIEGFWPSVNYLLEIRPYPELLPDTPERRGAVRSLTELIKSDPSQLEELGLYYSASSTGFMTPRPLLVDFAVAAYASEKTLERLPWTSRTRDAVHRLIESEATTL